MSQFTNQIEARQTNLLPTIALLPWGDLIEDFLDTIGISFEAFCNEMTGGWLFGYIEALKLTGVNTIVFCISARVQQVTRYTHKPTGAIICVLPAPNIHTQVRRATLNPDGWRLEETLQVVTPIRHLFLTALKDIAPYLATPIRTLAQLLRREGCQAILCQEYEYARFDVCVLLGKLLNIPVFASFQGGNFQVSRLEAPLRPFTLKACAGLIVASQTERDRLQTLYGLPASKIAPIFNPLDLHLWYADRTDPDTLTQRQQTRAELGITPKALVVVNHGRIEIYRKGLDILLEAWQQICRDLPHQNLILLLIGTGSDANTLAQQITDLNLTNVVWVNEYILDRAVMRRYLLAADLYTLPSRHEGFPVAPIEAMACGLSIVATDSSGVPDILVDGERSGGLMVPRGNPNALAAAIRSLLEDATWRIALGQFAQQRAATAFSLKSVGQQLRQALNT